MIIALVYLLVYLLCGNACIRFLLPRHRPLNRLWLGTSLGLLLEMWLPALCAFFMRFSVRGHLVALALLAVVTLLCYFLRDKHAPRTWDGGESTLLRQLLLIVIPLTVLSAYLQYTHVMRVDAYGNWNVGQSTYGDLPMHLSFITGLKNAAFPADYPFYPGVRLSYPFLSDTLSTTFYLFGCSLQLATVLPATLMMCLCFTGVMILAREMTSGKKTVILVALLFFLNGGLGFLYNFDQAAGTESNGTLTLVTRLRSILEGYYKTPTNQPEPNNLRWSNVIADLMVPQRTLLGGWCMVIPCFYLLETLFNTEHRETCDMMKVRAGTDFRGLVLLGIWAGALPLIHTHSFLALALSSLGVLLYDLIHGDPKEWKIRRPRTEILGTYVLYGAIAAALALPQLICFTFSQTFQADGNSFLTFQFNWVNNPGGNGMRDFYLWFYLKNIGLPFGILILSLFEKDRKTRRNFAGAVLIILAAELIRFQPNEYDNNKLFYLAWLLCCMCVADWCRKLWHRLKGLSSRPVIAAVAAFVFFFSAGLTLWRECVSDYQAYSAEAVEAGKFARDKTEEDAVYLTGTQHLNPVLSIAGKTIVCGPDLWLYWHGFDTTERRMDLYCFYEDPTEYAYVLNKYNVDYIYVSSYERASYEVDTETLDALYPKVFENSEATVYKVPHG